MHPWETGPPEPWDPSEDGIEPDPQQQAFAAYQDAWGERERTGSASIDVLLAALRARNVPADEYADGTRLRRTLFDSWHAGRRPGRMHGVILRHRIGSVADGFRELRDIFRRDHTPEHMRLPDGLVPASTWRPADDDTSLTFSPAGTFAARVEAWYEAIDEDERERPIPVWLDTQSRPERTPVMVGRDLAGYADLPGWAHALLVDATRRGSTVVATGDLWVKRRKRGTWRAELISVELPERDD